MFDRCHRHGPLLETFFDERALIVQGIGRIRRRDEHFDELFTQAERRVVAAGVPPMFTLRPALRDLHDRGDGPTFVDEAAAAADRANDHIRSLISEPRWPSREEIGWTGAFAAAALVGHADDDATLRRAAIEHMRDGVGHGVVDPRRFAHIVDRANAMDGKPQLYGTLFVPVDGQPTAVWAMAPTDEVANARRSIGLPSLEQDTSRYERGATPGPFLIPFTRPDWILLGVRLTLSGLRHGRHAV